MTAVISASLVKQLRDETGAGMMDCKNALTAASGDVGAAKTWLREKGLSRAASKAGRTTNEGVVELYLDGGTAASRTGVLLELNCESDFVARTDQFRNLARTLAHEVAVSSSLTTLDELMSGPASSDEGRSVADLVSDAVAALGENVSVARFTRLAIPEGAEGRVDGYVHDASGSARIGVLLHLSCQSRKAAESEPLSELAREIALQIAGMAPAYISREDVPESLVAAERDIYRKQVEGKPENIVEKIIAGKLDSYFAGICLLDQPWVRDDKRKIADLLASASSQLSETVSVGRFFRYQVGEVGDGTSADQSQA